MGKSFVECKMVKSLQKWRFGRGQNGPITVPARQGKISIGTDGSLAVGGQNFDKLKVVRFNNPISAFEQ